MWSAEYTRLGVPVLWPWKRPVVMLQPQAARALVTHEYFPSLHTGRWELDAFQHALRIHLFRRLVLTLIRHLELVWLTAAANWLFAPKLMASIWAAHCALVVPVQARAVDAHIRDWLALVLAQSVVI